MKNPYSFVGCVLLIVFGVLCVLHFLFLIFNDDEDCYL